VPALPLEMQHLGVDVTALPIQVCFKNDSLAEKTGIEGFRDLTAINSILCEKRNIFFSFFGALWLTGVYEDKFWHQLIKSSFFRKFGVRRPV